MASDPHPFYPTRVVRRDDAGGGLVLLTLEPSADVGRSYARPGQYVTLRAGRQSSYFVLAGDVGSPRWQLLLRPGTAVADAAIAVQPGAEVEVTQALGGGFPIDEATGRLLLCAATGTGIAALRPVVRHRVATGDVGRTALFFGVRARAELPLDGELSGWRADGVKTVVCLSRESAEGSADVAQGYVQDVVRQAVQAGTTKVDSGMIFAAGVKGMISGIRALAASLGVAESDVRTNY